MGGGGGAVHVFLRQFVPRILAYKEKVNISQAMLCLFSEKVT